MRDPQAPPTILIVEDEAKLASLLTDYLRSANFDARWLADGRDVAPVMKTHAPDLILLDLMLPGRDGIAVCRELREFTDTPVIMVTGRVNEIDRLLGLELGADDYICKPFSPRELVARVNAVLRRSRSTEATAHRMRLVIDRQTYRASWDGEPLALTPAEFRLLEALAQHPNKVWSRDQLLDCLYTDHRVVADQQIVRCDLDRIRRLARNANRRSRARECPASGRDQRRCIAAKHGQCEIDDLADVTRSAVHDNTGTATSLQRERHETADGGT